MRSLLIILSVLQGILAGDYNAKTLSVAEQDSILNGISEQRYRLVSENEEKIFRHSSVADWYIVDTQKNSRKQLGAGLNLGKVRDAVMSPNGRYVAFAKDNNLYIHKLDFGTEIAVTKDENTDIINGVADWLYEEEFGTTALFAWSPDSKMLAFVKLDEREVPGFSWQNYLGGQYPTADTLRYPKAGCTNAKASVCVYDVPTKGILKMQVNPKDEDVYFPRLKWINETTVMVLRLNRDQTKMEVLSCNAKSTVANLLYTEESKKYFVNYELFDQWQWLTDGRMIVLSEKDGWQRAYLYNAQGMEIKALTPEDMDVMAIYGVNEKTQTLFYQAAPTPSTRHIYGLNLKKGTITQVTKEEGMWSARFAKDCNSSILCHQSFDTPNEYIYSSKDKWNIIEDNADVKAAWQANKLPEPQLLRINNGNGQELEAMLLSPATGNPSPLILMHYSGPQSQRVLNRWRKRFEYALVEAGYAVLIVDPRGTDCRGRAWRNETYMSLGQKEAEDLIAAARWAANRPDIDGERMAILGWSYGGYQTLMTMSQKNHPFKAGVAIAPVTDWKLYDSAYTERYMRRPQVNDRGYDEASLLNKAADLTGNVLIIHGTADDNVHVQQTMQYIDALVRADKQFEMQLYPDDNHFLKKGNNASHMHNRVLQFLQKNL
ncbi:MAG: alpha/beta fold hydrolase [Paludibacteraceae bacterium]|nr:alpha/beta fold hydrolase [Paludibacteraceae bacterium]